MKAGIKSKIIIFLLILTSAGCLNTNKNEVKEDFTGITLEVSTTFGETDGKTEYYKNLINELTAETGMVINDHSKDSDEQWKNEILSSFDNGSEPDILFFFTGADIAPVIESGKVVDLQTIRAVYPNYAENVNLNVLNAVKRKDGKIYAVPVSGYWEALFINKDLFDANNIPLPKDWESLNKAVESFNKLGIAPFAAALGDIPHYLFEFFVYNYTGPSVHTLTISTPEKWVPGLNEFKTFFEMGAFPKDTLTMTNGESFQLFLDKKAAMLLEGSWKVGSIKDTENVIVMPFPSKNENIRKSTDMIGGFSTGFYITKKAWDNPDKRDAVISFMNKMTSVEALMLYSSSGASKSISGESQAETNIMLSINEMTQNATAYIDAVQDSLLPETRAKLFAEIPRIATGDVSPEEAINNTLK